MKVISLNEETSKTYQKLKHKFTLTSSHLNFNQTQLNMAVTPKQPNLVSAGFSNCVFNLNILLINMFYCISKYFPKTVI